jgi:hypothetical protein
MQKKSFKEKQKKHAAIQSTEALQRNERLKRKASRPAPVQYETKPFKPGPRVKESFYSKTKWPIQAAEPIKAQMIDVDQLTKKAR